MIVPARFTHGRGLIVSIAVVFVAVWLVWEAIGYFTDPGTAGASTGVDRPAPPFTERLLTGEGTLSLSEYSGNVVVLHFWASWCTACRSEAPELDAIWRSFRTKGVQFVGVDYDDKQGSAVDFAHSVGIDYPSVADTAGTVGDLYGVIGLPTTYIIGIDGHIHYVFTGKTHVHAVRSALRSLLPVPEVARP